MQINIPDSWEVTLGTAGKFKLDGTKIPHDVIVHAAWSGLSRKLSIEAADFIRDGGSPYDVIPHITSFAEKLIYSGLWNAPNSRGSKAPDPVTFESFREVRAEDWAKSRVDISSKGLAKSAVTVASANRKALIAKGANPDSPETQAKLRRIYLANAKLLELDEKLWAIREAKRAAKEAVAGMADELSDMFDALPGNT